MTAPSPASGDPHLPTEATARVGHQIESVDPIANLVRRVAAEKNVGDE
jgi:hypothetical protein